MYILVDMVLYHMRYIGVFVAIALVLLYKFNNAKPEYKHQIYRDYITSSFDFVPVLSGYKQGGEKILGNLFEGLLQLSKYGKPVAGMVSKWTVDENNKHYRFYIRPDAYWSDGTKVIAYDFELGVKKSLMSDIKQERANLLLVKNVPEFIKGNVDLDSIGVRAVNDSELVITLSKSATYFDKIISQSKVFLPLPSHKVNIDTPASEIQSLLFEEKISNGPYMIDLDHDRFAAVKLKRNPYYYRKANIPYVSYIYLKPSHVYSAFYLGALDITQGPRTIDRQEILDKFGSKVYLNTSRMSYFLAVRPSLMTKYKDLVKAISMALDRDRLMKSTKDKRLRVSYSIIPSNRHWYKNPIKHEGVHVSDIDIGNRIKIAKEIMRAMGFNNTNTLNVKFVISKNSPLYSMVQQLQYMLDRIYINLQIASCSMPACYDIMREFKYDITVASWMMDYSDLTAWLNVFRSSRLPNIFGFKNADFDMILNKAEIYSGKARKNMLLKAQKILLNHGNIVPLFVDGQSMVIVSNRVAGYGLFENGTYIDIQYIDLLNLY